MTKLSVDLEVVYVPCPPNQVPAFKEALRLFYSIADRLATEVCGEPAIFIPLKHQNDEEDSTDSQNTE